MITCKNIKKKFNEFVLFNNFSYIFKNHGLYVLYGVSGSGKTTLLQMLLGIIDFDYGKIIFDNQEYEKKVSFAEIQDSVAYISQDSYFIDYLNIEENLKLQSGKNLEEIINVSKKFSLDSFLKKFPNQLSGGERQRFAIIGNILQNKKIFLLDEPTSSLDKNNKKIFYDLLFKLKNDCLIICASHDDSIFDYSDDIIDFNELNKYRKIPKYELMEKNEIKLEKKAKYNSVLVILKNLYKQIFRAEKKFVCLYLFIFTFTFILLFSCTNYEDKVIGSLVDNHNLKSILILCSLKSGDYCEDILSNYSVSEVVYHYTRNLPIEEEQEGGNNNIADFTFDILSLPYSKENMEKIDELLLYGTYYNAKNQVILGYDKAISLAEERNIMIQDLIGLDIELKLPDGSDTFEIVGIFKDLDEKSNVFLRANLGQYDFKFYYFLNSWYLEKYLYDDVLGMDEKSELKATSLVVFFKDTESFLNFYYDYIDKDLSNSLLRIENPVDYFAEYYTVNQLIRGICFVTSICFFVLGMLFYYQIHKTRISHTEHNFSIFEYYGYKEKDVKTATILYFITYIMAIILFSSLIASCLSFIINEYILFKNILPYSLLVIDLSSIILVLSMGIIISFFEGILLNYSRRKKGWFYLIKEKSDLL